MKSKYSLTLNILEGPIEFHTLKNSCLLFTGHFVYKVITFPYNYNKQNININEWNHKGPKM